MPWQIFTTVNINICCLTEQEGKYTFCLTFVLQSFGDLVHKPLLVDLTVEEGQRLKVIYGSCSGFHAVDVDSGAVYDIYLPTHVKKQKQKQKHIHNIYGLKKKTSAYNMFVLCPCRFRPISSLMPSSSCPTPTASSCWCAMRMRVFMLTPMDALPRTWCCSGGRCPPQWVSHKGKSNITHFHNLH